MWKHAIIIRVIRAHFHLIYNYLAEFVSKWFFLIKKSSRHTGCLADFSLILFSNFCLPGKGFEATQSIMTDHLAKLFSSFHFSNPQPSFHSTSFVRKNNFTLLACVPHYQPTCETSVFSLHFRNWHKVSFGFYMYIHTVVQI